MKSGILNLLFICFSVSAFASQELLQRSVSVEPNSNLQKLIDLSFVTVLTQNQNQELVCKLFGGPIDLHYSHGISFEAANKIYEKCPKGKPIVLSKTLLKRYYLSGPHSTFESWTDQSNRTFLFLDENSTFFDLQTRLLHEMAISMDAKNQMLYTGYLRYEIASENQRVIVINDLNENEKNIQTAFNLSLWLPITRGFSTLRALQFEKVLETGRSQILSHKECTLRAQEMIQLMKQIPQYSPANPIDELTNLLTQTTHRNFTPRDEQHEKQILEFLLSPDLRLKTRQGQKLSFCQYMTTPLLTSRSLYNGFSHGPRPRVTGGSGGQGGGTGDGKNNGSMIMTPSFDELKMNQEENMLLQIEIQKFKKTLKNQNLNESFDTDSIPSDAWEKIFNQ